MFPRIVNKDNLPYILIFIFAFCVGICLLFYPTRVDFFFLDLQYLLSHSFSPGTGVSENIVIINVDEVSQRNLNLRQGSELGKYYGQIIEKLISVGVKVIAFDIAFVTPDTQADPMLAYAFARSGNIVAGELSGQNTVKILRENMRGVGNLTTLDFDKIPRKIPVDITGVKQKPISVEIVEVYLDTSDNGIKPESNFPPTDSFWINFRQRPEYFPTFSFTYILESYTDRINDSIRTPLGFLKDKIVLIGYYQEQFVLPDLSGRKLPGVFSHAYAVDNLLNNTILKQVDMFLSIIILIIAFSALMIVRLSKIKYVKNIFPWLLLIALFILQYTIAFKRNYWFDYSSVFVSSICLTSLSSIYEIIKMKTDLRRLKMTVIEFEAYREGLEQRISMKDFLIDTSFHDIKNYVYSIDTGIGMLMSRFGGDSGLCRKLEVIKLASGNIEALSRNIIEAGQIEEGKLEAHIVAFDAARLSSIAQSYVDDPLCKVKGLKITIREPDIPFTIGADAFLLERILANLFNNAFKYSFQNGAVILSFEPGSSETIISLYNSGIPLTDEQRQHVFEKYYQARNNSPYSKGLGLYLCKLMMEMQGGRIWVESDGTGNYFKLGFRHGN
jgi:signal transduction histidine kinase